MSSPKAEKSATSAKEIEKEKGVCLKGGILPYSKLKCVSCGKCLSVRPVSGTNGQYTCGRCCPEAKQCPFYDGIAENFIFPCQFTGCESELNWGEVGAHEKSCHFRIISCPLPDCVDSYPFNSNKTHFTMAHSLRKSPYYSDRLRLTSPNSPHCNLLCILSDEIIIVVCVKIFRHSNSLRTAPYVCQFILFSMATDEKKLSNLECEVKIDLTSRMALSVTCKDFIQYSETQHCLKCLCGPCGQLDHTNMNKNLLINDLEFATKDKWFSYSIKVYKKISALDFDCPLCGGDLGEVIYMCDKGWEPFCKPCREAQITECLSCGTSTCRQARCPYLEKVVIDYRVVE